MIVGHVFAPSGSVLVGCNVIGVQAGEDQSSSEDLSRKDGRALLSVKPDTVSSVDVNRTSVARRYVAALNSEHEARADRATGTTRDRAARRRIDRTARRPKPTTAAVANLVSRPHDSFHTVRPSCAPCTPATMSKQHCRILQVERFFRQSRMLLPQRRTSLRH